MNKDTHISTEVNGNRSGRPLLRDQSPDQRTKGGWCAISHIQPAQLTPLCFTEMEAASMLSILPDDLHSEYERGAITYRLVGGRVRYTMDDLLEYLENSRVNCTLQRISGNTK